MLQAIRDKAQGWFLWIVVGLIVATFALWGVNSFFQSDKDVFVARVDGQEISVAEYQRAYQYERFRMQQMFGANFNAEMFEKTMKQSALDGLVDTAAMRLAATQAGFRVSDELLFSRIQTIESFQQNGKFSKGLYEQAVRQQGDSMGGFEQRVREAMLTDHLTQGVAQSNVVSDADIGAQYRLQHQQRDFEFVTIPVARFKDGVKIEDAQINDYYQKNKSRYQRPEQVRVDYIEVAAQDFEAGVKIDEGDLKQYFDEQQQKTTKSEERRARHILIQVDSGAAQDKVDAAKKKADDLYKRLKKGEDFAKLAGKESDDPGSKGNGGDLGFFGRGIMDEAFEKAAFSMKKGQLSEPVRSRFGFHIIKLDDVRGEQKKSLDSIRAEVIAEYRKQAAEKRFAEVYDSLANAAYEHPDSLAEAAKVAGVAIKTSEYFSRNGGPGVASNPKVSAAAFSNDVYKDNVNSELIEIGLNRVLVLRIKDKIAASDRPLDEVKPQIVNDLRDSGARDMVRDLGAKWVQALSAGKDLASLAKENKLVAEKATTARNDAKINGALLKAVFKMPKPASGKPRIESIALDNGDHAVVIFKGAIDAALVQADAAQKDAAKNDVSRMWSTAESSMLRKAIRDKFKIERYPDRL